PITVLVGPNNSGKSSFLGLGRFIQQVIRAGAQTAIEQEGGENFVFHRPRPKEAPLWVRWQSELGFYEAILSSARNQKSEQVGLINNSRYPEDYTPLLKSPEGLITIRNGHFPVSAPFEGLRHLVLNPEQFYRPLLFEDASPYLPIVEP